MTDYFAGPPPGSQRPPAPAGPWGPSAPPPPPQWGPPPGGQGGPPNGAWGPVPPGYPVPPPVKGKNRLAVVGPIVGGVVVLAVLAAIGLPSYHDQQTAKATSVSLPDQILGLPRLTDASGRQVEQQLGADPMPGTPVVGAYGPPGSPEIVVHVTHVTLTDAEQQGFMRGAQEGLPPKDRATFTPVDAGKLGGQVKCATTTFTICAFADPGAAGVILLLGSNAGQLDLVHQVREAFEHRS